VLWGCNFGSRFLAQEAGNLLVRLAAWWFAFIVLAPGSIAADWPQWRGPNRDGHAPGASLPDSFQTASLKRLWSVSSHPGYSGPVISKGRLVLFGRSGDDEVIECRDAESGERLWARSYPAPYKVNPAAREHGPWPKSTPTCDGDRIYCMGISSVLSCLAADTGKLIWRRDLAKEVGANAEYGAAASPLVLDKLLIVPVGGDRGGSIMAFDRQTGRTVWSAVPGQLPAMSSPIRAELGGVEQVVSFTEKELVGLSPSTGKVLWRYPYRTAYRQNIVTPVVCGDAVIESGYMKYTFALKPVRLAGGGFEPKLVWRSRDLRCYMSSPVLVAGYLYGQGARGELVCLDARTGQKQWSGGSFGRYCSIVVAADKLLILSDSGKLTVVAACPQQYRPLAAYPVCDEPTWAHLAVVGSRVYVRGLHKLVCYEWTDRAGK